MFCQPQPHKISKFSTGSNNQVLTSLFFHPALLFLLVVSLINVINVKGLIQNPGSHHCAVLEGFNCISYLTLKSILHSKQFFFLTSAKCVRNVTVFFFIKKHRCNHIIWDLGVYGRRWYTANVAIALFWMVDSNLPTGWNGLRLNVSVCWTKGKETVLLFITVNSILGSILSRGAASTCD